MKCEVRRNEDLETHELSLIISLFCADDKIFFNTQSEKVQIKLYEDVGLLFFPPSICEKAGFANACYCPGFATTQTLRLIDEGRKHFQENDNF